MTRRTLLQRAEAYAQNEASATFGDWYHGATRGYIGGHSAASRKARKLFDRVIDCMYEWDLGQEIPDHWPPDVRAAIETARKRILRRPI